MQKAGRHGGYATQFWTRPNRQPYRSRREMLTAHSKKSIQRRLVLPLDAHNWGRALEVLGASYAKLGRRAEDYQRVIRGIANETTLQGRCNAVHTLNALRDKMYAGEVVTSSSLWVTLVWAYARLRFPQEGYECLLQAERRFNFSPLTKQHMGETLLPLLAEFGMFVELNYVVDNFMGVGGCRQDKEFLAGLVAEAAARSGFWENAIIALTRETAKGDGGAQLTAPNMRTLASLFVSEEANDGGAALQTSQHLHKLSTAAVRRMMCSMADDGQWLIALRCLVGLQERGFEKNESSYLVRSSEVDNNNKSSIGGCSCSGATVAVSTSGEQLQNGVLWLSDDELQRLLNCLGSHHRWAEATALFAAYYFTDSSVSAVTNKERRLQATTLNLLFASFPRETREFCFVEQNEGQNSCSFCAIQKGEKEVENKATITLQLDSLHHPRQVVAVADRLLSERDDVFVTDWMMAAVGPSLVQLSEWDRALHLLRQAPIFSSPKVPLCTTEAHQHVRNKLVALLYYLHATVSFEAKCYTLYHFPFIFPKEAFSGLPPPSKFAAHTELMRQADTRAVPPASSLPFSGLLATRRFASRRRPAVVRHTERHDDELKRRLSSLYANRADAFRGGDADRDPRPIPKGLHDTASGWNFYGRGGEMVFMNHRRTAHPFTLHPKVMRSLADPYRGWRLSQNSCWGHRERVKKWNKNSAV